MSSAALSKVPEIPAIKYLVSIFFIFAAAALFIITASQAAFAQNVVAPTCPNGFVLSGNNCVKSAPSPSCPSGYTLSGGKCVARKPQPASTGTSTTIGPWAFITRKVFGLKSAKELKGAKYCAVKGSREANAAKGFFKKNDMASTLVPVDSNRDAMVEYQKSECDILIVEERSAKSILNTLKPKDSHEVLPETIGEAVAAPRPPERPAAPAPQPAQAAPQPPQAAPQPAQAAPKPQPVAKKPRCSAITFAYTRGNTCACSGGRVFTGRSCVRRR